MLSPNLGVLLGGPGNILPLEIHPILIEVLNRLPPRLVHDRPTTIDAGDGLSAQACRCLIAEIAAYRSAQIALAEALERATSRSVCS
jgi:hypothetical protein